MLSSLPIQRFKSLAASYARRVVARTGLDDGLARLTQGKSPKSFLARLAPACTEYPAPTVRTVERNGLELELDVSDYMQWCAYFGIAVEPREALYGLAQAGMCVLDVGTNVGETLLNLAKRVGRSGFVHGFEINPATFERCQRNVDRNRLGNIRLHQLGLGQSEGVLALERPTLRNTGGDRLRALGSTPATGTVSVPVTTLDAFVAAEKLDRIDLIKIDTEGFEMNIVRGGRETLRKCHPTLFMEVCDRNLRPYGAPASALIEELVALGYILHHAETGVPVGPDYPFANELFDVIGTAR